MEQLLPLDRPKDSGLSWPNATTWLVGLGTTLALAGQSAAFWMVGALTRSGGFGEQQAGLTVTAEMVTMGIVMLVLSPVVHRLPRRTTIMISVAIILLTQIASAFVPGFLPFVLVRVVAGIGFGALFSVAAAIGAATANPERTFALAGSISLVIGTAINPMLGYGSPLGAFGVFVALTIFCVGLSVPLLMVVMRGPGPAAVSPVHMPDGKVSKLSAAGVMMIMALMAGATNGVFVFVATIAGKVGIGGASMGTAMAGVSLLSASGGLVASRIGTRYGTLPPLAFGLVSIGAMLFWLANAHTVFAFWFAFTAVVTLYWFTFPYILGLASAVDPYGRVASATGTAKIFAGGLGAGISGTIAERVGIGTYGAIAFGFTLVAVTFAPFVIASTKRAKSSGANG